MLRPLNILKISSGVVGLDILLKRIICKKGRVLLISSDESTRL